MSGISLPFTTSDGVRFIDEGDGQPIALVHGCVGTSLVFESSGHSPHLSESDAFNRELLDFGAVPVS
jgi:hypothetical protein